MIRKMFRKPKPQKLVEDQNFAPTIDAAPVHVTDKHESAQYTDTRTVVDQKPVIKEDKKRVDTPFPASIPQPVVQSESLLSVDDLKTPMRNTWCPGCGNHSILFALRNALQKICVPHEDICVVYGIGCHGHLCNFLYTYNFEGLHGRPIPVAEGIKLANTKLKVIVVAGDGDTFGEGMNHFLAGLRANHDITVIVHNNMVYGLTTGQTSPTSQKGFVSKSTPDGVIEVPVNAMALGLAAGGGFLARGFSGNVAHLTDMITRALLHDGFSVVDVLQNCTTFNKVNTIRWFNERVYDIQKVGHDPANKVSALAKAFEFGEKIPIGVFYQDKRESYQDDVKEIQKTALLHHNVEGINLTKTFEKFV